MIQRTRSFLPRIFAASLLLTTSALAAPQDGSRATYRATWDLTWSSATHPGNYPSNAHVSPPIGATHAPGFHLWEPGGIATDGIESMAETGSVSALTGEINAAITAGTAGERLFMNGFDAPGTRSMEFDVTKEFSALTLVTMVAPTPDWFLGCDAVELLVGDVWVDTITIPLIVWDAGTDSGTNFTSSNQNTNPQDPIALEGNQFVSGGPALGTLSLTLPTSMSMVGTPLFIQGVFIEPGVKFGLTDAVEVVLGS